MIFPPFKVPYDVTYMWNLKYSPSEFICETETDTNTENRLVVAKAGGGWGRRIRSLGLADSNYYIENE